MKEIKLTMQLNFIFTIVTLLTSFVFIIALNRVFDDFRDEQNMQQLQLYFDDVRLSTSFTPDSNYNGYVISQNGIIQDSNNLVFKLNHLLAKFTEYPLEAKGNGDEGMVRAAVFFNPDNSKASIKFAKGNLKSLESALNEAFNNLKVCKLMPENYQGRKTVSIKVNFELD